MQRHLGDFSRDSSFLKPDYDCLATPTLVSSEKIQLQDSGCNQGATTDATMALQDVMVAPKLDDSF